MKKYTGWGIGNSPFNRAQFNNSYLKESNSWTYEQYLQNYVRFVGKKKQNIKQPFKKKISETMSKKQKPKRMDFDILGTGGKQKRKKKQYNFDLFGL